MYIYLERYTCIYVHVLIDCANYIHNNICTITCIIYTTSTSTSTSTSTTTTTTLEGLALLGGLAILGDIR